MGLDLLILLCAPPKGPMALTRNCYFIFWCCGLNIGRCAHRTGTVSLSRVTVSALEGQKCGSRRLCNQLSPTQPSPLPCLPRALHGQLVRRCALILVAILSASPCLPHEHACSVTDHQLSPRTGSPGNHKSPSSALSSVLHSIPSGRKQKKIPAALKEVSDCVKADEAAAPEEQYRFQPH